ncbi:metallo-beta-lactamase superfamily protein [Colletotrichum scovillei]|uniref:Metallo-beta-lactamase superfamily protein n=1 Tax=Colletotrichum scovillei TaxID=1209932 RepID=A0A9P7R1N5_9PEZI|nr:metallo-beta-lactamase superfamily protein [Colletotrichum scovillei]KAF4773092.1 metallo-beta-lactamase superfamily protein [Colletotrichum scovillei]KAG7046858.1 metallo-beta-lactamase superfamily protein [Colletotrichum scovillei]KAG7056695.1 metallo-beta-lactamase superfamily protein [Colletotrichum scovillei]KAG7066590.1 metallo-beta-lactamase superfamily protein [Colletotrichum scovillei]
MASQLVSLPEVERLSPACIRILGGNPGKFTLQGTNTYLVGTGSRRILIDTGEGKPSWIAAVKSILEQEKATVEKVLITHWHHDHTGGIQQLLELSPSSEVFKNQPEQGQSDISDGQKFSVDGVSLTAVFTPGHTVDHMAFVLEEEDAMFTADNVLGQGTAVFEDLTVYLNSLERMQSLFKGRAYPGHGPVIDNGPSKIQDYINHRKAREEQVIRTLRTARQGSNIEGDPYAWTVMELVKVIYADVPEELHIPASGGVIQILGKLEKENKVVQSDERWKLKDRSAL